MLWVVLAFVATVSWGLAYTVVRLVKVHPMILNVTYGLLLSTAGLVVHLIQVYQNPVEFVTAWTAVRDASYLPVYLMLMVMASTCYFTASQLTGVDTTLLTAITSNYQLVTMLLGFLVFQDYRRMHLTYAIPGLICGVISCVLLAMSPRAV